jgi:hypothetical protein
MATRTGGLTAPVALVSATAQGPFKYLHALILMQKHQLVTGGVPQEDTYGQPVEAAVSEIAFNGLLVERSSAKLVQANEAGPTVTVYSLKAPPSLPIAKGDLVRWAAADLRRYEVNGDPYPAGGRAHHLEVPMKLVSPDV